MGTIKWWVVCSALLVMGCGANFQARTVLTSKGFQGNPDPEPEPGEEIAPICSDLDFTQYEWPKDLITFESEAFQLGLNISGSFEGHEGWQNLTNDFDGQGVSMGLLNQNLGTGSLQPMLIRMRNEYPAALKKSFSTAHHNSLLKMLEQWQDTSVTSLSELPFLSLLDNEAIRLGVLDTRSINSATWARQNLYARAGVFHTSWRNELIALMETPEYTSIQIDSAWHLHDKTMDLLERLKVTELRSYLVMFDIVVQNGSLYQVDHDDYQAWLKNNLQATTEQRLTKIVELRLRHVKPQYVADVRARKFSLIEGVGAVHGSRREYEKEYCFDRLQPFP